MDSLASIQAHGLQDPQVFELVTVFRNSCAVTQRHHVVACCRQTQLGLKRFYLKDFVIYYRCLENIGFIALGGSVEIFGMLSFSICFDQIEDLFELL